MLSAVAPYPALPHGTSFDEANRKGLGYAQMYNLTGWPTATVRVGTSPEGLPINVQVAARRWREDVAQALAAHLLQSNLANVRSSAQTAVGIFQPPKVFSR